VNNGRRGFLKKVGLFGLGGSIGGLGGTRADASTTHNVLESWHGVLVDLTKCNGCRQCEAACQKAAGFEAPTPEELKDGSVFNHVRRPGTRSYTTVNEYRLPHDAGEGTSIYVKSNCLHCNDPACASACLVGAMRKESDGAVSYDAWKCMGCRYCMVACPFQMPTYEYDNVFTPQVRKCTLCSNEGNPNRGDIPACVKACPKECLTYGKRSELLERAREKITQHRDTYIEHIYGEHEAGGTSWLYLSGVPFQELGFLQVDPEAPPRLSETIQHGVFKHFVPPIAWCGVLGLAMWLTRPEPIQAPDAPSVDKRRETVVGRTRDRTTASVR
jgi:Fe-S-cluster-containing dehydrogenase component